MNGMSLEKAIEHGKNANRILAQKPLIVLAETMEAVNGVRETELTKIRKRI